jgi:hypothetical protein
MLPYVFDGEKSGWSNTQTIAIPDPSVPSSSPTPSTEPETFPTTIIIVSASILAIASVSLLVYFKNILEVRISPHDKISAFKATQ